MKYIANMLSSLSDNVYTGIMKVICGLGHNILLNEWASYCWQVPARGLRKTLRRFLLLSIFMKLPAHPLLMVCKKFVRDFRYDALRT